MTEFNSQRKSRMRGKRKRDKKRMSRDREINKESRAIKISQEISNLIAQMISDNFKNLGSKIIIILNFRLCKHIYNI